MPEDDQKPFPRRWASTGDHSAIDVCSRGRASTEIGLTGSFRGPLLTLVVASAVIAVAGCGLSDSGPCAIADGQEPLDGRTHEQVLEELSEPDSGWPEVPDGDWKREEVEETVVYRNGDAEVSFIDDALMSVMTC